MAARSKAWVSGCSPAEIVGLNSTEGMDVCFECRLLSGRGLCDERSMYFYITYVSICCQCRSHWPRLLRRRSASARLLRLGVQIPPGHGCLSVVSVVCRQVEVSATS